MENGWYCSPNVLYIVIVKCFAVNRILASSDYMKEMCVLSRYLKSMLNSTVISNIDFARGAVAILLLSTLSTSDSMGTFSLRPFTVFSVHF
jgi:hypothetical protein